MYEQASPSLCATGVNRHQKHSTAAARRAEEAQSILKLRHTLVNCFVDYPIIKSNQDRQFVDAVQFIFGWQSCFQQIE